MVARLFSLFSSLLDSLTSRAALHAEILALRHQLLVLQRTNPKHRLRMRALARVFWVWLSRLWSGWRSPLVIVKPATVIAWHRKGFRLYWTWQSRARLGRHPITKAARELIRRMSIANPLWGAPRIHGELLKLGIDVAQATVAKYMVRKLKPPSQTWKTFLPFAVTYHPTAEWTSQQLVQVFPWDSAPKYLLRDRDGSYGQLFLKPRVLWASKRSSPLPIPRGRIPTVNGWSVQFGGTASTMSSF
jgi:putative transposase